jgi:hypothetical protein
VENSGPFRHVTSTDPGGRPSERSGVVSRGPQYDLPIATTSDEQDMTTQDDAAPVPPDAPVSTLRGASRPSVDGRKAAQIVVGLIMATLAVLGIVFIVVGINKNSQINELKSKGVAVTFVVSKCVGQLGGSGSNVAGYACQGSYQIDGRRYSENLPGSTYYAPGARVPAVSVRSDPNLLSTPAIVRSDRASANVFVLPAVLLVACALILVVVLLRRRRQHRAAAEVR